MPRSRRCATSWPTKFGPLDVLVHCIAFANKEDLAGKVFDTSRAGYALALDVSAYSLIAMVSALRDSFADGASIIALTYLGATQIVPNYNLMGIAKAALEATVRYIAFDLGDRNIRVNAISAGPIKTASSAKSAVFHGSWTSFRRSRRCVATLLQKTSERRRLSRIGSRFGRHRRRALRRRGLPCHGNVCGIRTRVRNTSSFDPSTSSGQLRELRMTSGEFAV